MKIRAGDTVIVTTGKDKGKTGTVLKVLQNKGRVVVSDCNMRTKHVKSYPNRPGQILKYEASMDASNVQIVDPKTKKATRVGYKKDDKGKTVRFAKASGEVIKKGKVAAKKKESNDSKESGETKEKVAKTTKTKTAVKTEEKKAEKKSPFWKNLGFGASEEASSDEVKKESHMEEDHSVPEAGQSPDTRTHQRGN